jgi:iron(III) transport system ATP-binding protein
VSALSCSGLTKRFGDITAVNAVDLEVRAGEVFALLGPSGCGKTTLLRLIAGLERATAGELWVDGEVVDDSVTGFVPPEARRVGLVFQQFALFPHLDVAANVAFGLKGKDPARVDALLELTRLSRRRDARPETLSGGEQQRVALARALAPRPAAVLLDEPFANLDAQLRVDVREQVRAILAEEGATAILVTHDREEALSLADRIAVMGEGEILQVGTPEALYRSPESVAVARLVGDGAALRATAEGGRSRCCLGVVDGEGGHVFLRPEDLEVAAEGAAGEVIARRFVGHAQLLRVKIDDEIVEVRHAADQHVNVGDPLHLKLVGGIALP